MVSDRPKVWPQGFERDRTDTPHLEQIVVAGKRPVVPAVGNDALGSGRAQPW